LTEGQRGQQPGSNVAILAFHAAHRRIQQAAEAQQLASSVKQAVQQRAQLLHTQLQAGLAALDVAIAEAEASIQRIQAAAPARRSSRGRLTNMDRARIDNLGGQAATFRAQQDALKARMGQAAMQLYGDAIQGLSQHNLAHLPPVQELLVDLSAGFLQLARGELRLGL
jgi:seryl-tRNA(Sec) selenium transferase